MMPINGPKRLAGPLLAAVGGAAWLIGGVSLWGPLLSILLPLATAISVSRKWAFASALAYYLIGSVSITGAIAGYYGAGHQIIGALAWIGASVALALPWTLGRSAAGRLFALIATAVPPLGVIGWLSPLNAAGVMFPSAKWFGLGLTVAVLVCFHIGQTRETNPIFARCSMLAKAILGIGVSIGVGSGLFVSEAFEQPVPSGWAGLDTRIAPARGNLRVGIQNKQTLIEAGRAIRSARVVVFPEAVLDDWLPGTRQQFALAVPPGQTWLIGAQVRPSQAPDVAPRPDGKAVNAVVVVEQGRAHPMALTAAAGLLLGGNWRPWSSQGLQPGIQRGFTLAGQRVWAALCVEQLQPWTWRLAMLDRPTLILAMNNAWWSPPGSFAPKIQAASTKSWARLINVPVIWASNRAP
jgi:hypothetical protein